MQKGQSLIELLIAIALAAVIIPGILSGLIASREGKAQEGQRLQALTYLKEEEEAVRSVREAGWSNIASNNTYHPVQGATSWSLATGSETINSNFTRQVAISSVQRDSSGNIVLSGGVIDPSTKLAVYTVSWTTPNPGSVTTTEYLQRYLGNTTLVHTTQADFNGGTFNNTESDTTGGGSVRLSNVGSSSYSFVDDYTSPVSYTYDSNKIEVLNGFAELKPINTPVSGATTNPGFDTTANPWVRVNYGDGVGQAGARIATGGIPGAWLREVTNKNHNKAGGLYYRQPTTTTVPNVTGTLTFNWQVLVFNPTVTSLHLYAWLDTIATGVPTTQVWDSGNIISVMPWSGTVTVDVSPQMVTAGTYYLKIGAFVDYDTVLNGGPFTIGYDNALLSWTGNIVSYDTTSPTIYPIASFVPSNVFSWSSFTATEITNGGSIMYQLSDDNGVTWKYWSGGWQTATLPTHYNSAATVNQFIPAFSAASGQIKVRAFLISNGAQFVRLDKIQIGYNGSAFPNSGDFISATMDAGANAGFNNINWTEVNTANTTTRLQIATNSDNATWSFVGPDGTSGTYFTGGYGAINLVNVSGRYLRYKIYFTSTNTDIPYVTDLSVNYSP
ncbi:MAG: hypothetical protein WCV81_04260 [Microgenomates group bacterium]|jgi:hypothetical protein